MKKLRIAFMGTPEFALVALKNLVLYGHDIICVYSKSPTYIGKKIIKSPVYVWAEKQDFTIHTPISLKNDFEINKFKNLNIDITIVAAYGLILPKDILDHPKYGSINIHPSLLPRWRGAAPIQRSLLVGDKETGITIMQMQSNIDSGDILMQHSIKISNNMYFNDLYQSLATLGSNLIIDTLRKILNKNLIPRKQSQDLSIMTYAQKISPEEGKIDFSNNAYYIERKIRALTPSPGTYFNIGKERIKVYCSKVIEISGPIGKILDNEFTIGCGKYAIRPTYIQRSGKKRMNTKSFLNGYSKILKGIIVS